MSGINPYNCAKPGNLFVGYDRLRQELLNGFRNDHSYAILGGRRCGKTSLLLQLQKDLQSSAPSPLWPLPRLLDIQGLDQITPYFLFQKLYTLTVEGIDAPPFLPGESEGAYQQFLRALKKAEPIIEQRYGPFWVVIFLIDELDVAIDFLPNDQFFQNLRNFLMMSDFHRHFRLVASGVNEMAKLISSGSSPLNNLRNKYLGILSIGQTRQLLLQGFPQGLDPDVEVLLLQLTGRHPYLLQGLLEKLYDTGTPPDRAMVKTAAREFLREHHDFVRWLEMFDDTTHAVYQLLSQTTDGTLHVRDIRHGLTSSMAPRCDDALAVLSYHGIVDDSDADEPQIAGTMFRDWYRSNVPKQEKPQGLRPEGLQAIRVFYSYSHKDEKFREKLETHLALLKRQKVIDTWQDRQITAGQEWRTQIHEQLEAADIILLLISADFLASDFCYDQEMTRAIQRHDTGTARVIPIIVRPVSWDSAPFAKLQALPKEGKAIITWDHEDTAWVDVERGIRKVAEELRKQ